MFCINLDTTDPFFNLALEEYLLKNTEDEYLILGRNDPSVIIGKHQSAHREVNTRFITENHIPVIRRISGGGTVFHDGGNLNFTFIRQSEAGKQVDFRKYTQPVIDYLKYLNVDVKFEGKSDLKVEGYKISGNAEHVHRNRVLHHGTLLFSSSLEMLRNSIRKDPSCYSSRAVVSNPVSVMNLSEKINIFKDIDEFRLGMISFFLKNFSDLKPYKINLSQTHAAESLSASKYKSWEWNWAYGPEYTFKNSFIFANQRHFCSLLVKDGIITECIIEGSLSMSSISGKLVGCRHMVEDLQRILRGENAFLSEDDIYNFF
jgi:lipoate---protein ligase